MTQLQLAEMVGVTRKTINVIEAGGYTPSVSLALAIAQVFKMPVEQIFMLTD
jgi:putative transcriptional regulator